MSDICQSRRQVLASVGASAALTFGGCSALFQDDDIGPITGEWPQYCFDSMNTGHSSTTRGPVKNGEVGWKFNINDVFRASPVISDESLYIGSRDSKLYKLDARTGGKEWEFITGGDIYSTPAVSDGVVYVGSYDGSVYAVDAASGKKKWSLETSDYIQSSPTLKENSLYIGNNDGKLYSIDTHSGEKHWEYDTESYIYQSPAVAGEYVCVGTGDGDVYNIQRQTGSERWTFTAKKEILSSPVVENGKTIICGDEKIRSLDLMSGREQWSFETDHAAYYTPAVSNGVLCAGTRLPIDNNVVLGLRTKDGKLLWSSDTNGLATSPAAAENATYLVREHGEGNYILSAIDVRTGNAHWEHPLDRWPGLGIAVVDGAVFLSGSERAPNTGTVLSIVE